MIDEHIAHMLRNRAEKYDLREVFRYKIENTYHSINWRTFKNQSEIIASFLLNCGVNIQDNIGIFSYNCPQWTIADLAILSCRCVIVPFYSTSTTQQLEYIINETEMKILFIGDEEQVQKALPLLNIDTCSLELIITFNCPQQKDDRVIELETIMNSNYSNRTQTELAERLNSGQSSDLATIIYTSGTTGEPKGVMLDHSNFMASFRIHKKRLSVDDTDISLCFLPLSHIFERGWTYFLLYSGGTNVYNKDPKEITKELPIVQPTVMCVVPRFFEKVYDRIISVSEEGGTIKKSIFNWSIAVGHKYIEYQKDDIKTPYLLSIKHSVADKLVFSKIRKFFGNQIKFMPCSGAAMTPELKRFFHALGIFVNYGYGATETLATVSCMRSDKYDFNYTGEIMPEIEVKISEDNMILVKGETIFKGYYKKPEQTNEVLIDGWYYTGDQGQLTGNNQLYMSERIKDIIKTSTGKYISPQKIELLLSKSEMIEQTCIIGDSRHYITALLVPAYEKLSEWLKQKGETISEVNQMITHKMVQTYFEEIIEEIQSELPIHEQIVKFALLPEPFTIENGMLTNSLKVRRKQVISCYQNLIESLY
ncbi:AMP-dependent synthetase/ligase [Carboxylicivirga caseinilyticus]|uniref:AMP-dependent synthetase/ligase n=1 Tax=Carboxylicivirga caseinilyticus TaxID=3417572 RepID=UPI003D33BE3C|nr:long-chain fatty acid--CoA ligase [Marinilabiliaceae bacterium A049]